MESAFLLNFGSNITTLGCALGIYILYKRCVHSRCAIHAPWLDCESAEIKEMKQKKAIALFKTAMTQYDQETQRYNKNERAEQSSEVRVADNRDVRRYENRAEGSQV